APATEELRREVRVGVSGLPSTLDPATALEGAVPLVAHQLFDTLVAYREGSTDIEPALAIRWSVGRDGLVWSFLLRDGVRFHDGTARLVGAGRYRVVDASPGRLALEAVPSHWAGPPRSERLVILDVVTEDQAEGDLDANTLDIWFPAWPPRRAEGALSVPGLRVGYLAFQTEKEPLSRKKVRQAIAVALDPAALGVALERTAVPLQSFLPPGVWGRREGSSLLGGGRQTVKALLAEGGGWAT